MKFEEGCRYLVKDKTAVLSNKHSVFAVEVIEISPSGNHIYLILPGCGGWYNPKDIEIVEQLMELSHDK